MEIIKQHNSVLSQVFRSQEEFDKHESECEQYGNMYKNIMAALREKIPTVHIYGKFGSICPYSQYFTIDALDPQDFPNHIPENSIYISFKIDLRANSVETHTTGHIHLTDADKRKSYLCMCGMKDCHQAMGGKWMRKSKFKSAEHLADKVEKFWLDVMANVEKATGGYPYNKMQVDIY